MTMTRDDEWWIKRIKAGEPIEKVRMAMIEMCAADPCFASNFSPIEMIFFELITFHYEQWRELQELPPSPPCPARSRLH